MSGRWPRFWAWGGRAHESEPGAESGDDDDPLAAAIKALADAETGATTNTPRGAVEYARELCQLGTEYSQLADELEATARLHRDAAGRVGRQAASMLAGPAPEEGPALPPPTPGLVLVPPPPEIVPDPEVADVEVRALGPLDVRVAGASVTSWGGRRIRTLFQYLLVHRRPVHREVLMDLLWPGYTYSSARGNLNVCLYGLRRALGSSGAASGFIVYRDGCYALDRELSWSIDRDRFVEAVEAARRHAAGGRRDEALAASQRAIAAYAGPLFDGDPPADWFALDRTSLHESFLQTLERQAELLLHRGDLTGAQHALERLLREDGCRESAHRALMCCFARRDQRDLVARQFQRCVSRLDTELDIAPSEETVRLYRRLTGG